MAEYHSVKTTGVFSAAKNTMMGKWFAETLEHAFEWHKRLGDVTPAYVIKVDLPDATAAMLHSVDFLDGIGPGRYAELDQLDEVVILAFISIP